MSKAHTVATDLPLTADSHYKWYVLILAALTHTLVMGMPTMSLPVLFDEIARDLDMSIVQVGVIWGMGSLTGIFMGLSGGIIGDRIGAQRTLMIACFLAGGLGALRGFSSNYSALVATVFLFGLIPPIIPTNVHKTCGIWFSGRRLGLANGVVSTGMALGFMLGAMLSATVLSPWLGGWRNVLVFYGVIAAIIGVFWTFTRAAPSSTRSATMKAVPVPLRQGLPHVVRIRNIWYLSLAMFGIGGCIQGTLGYLPLYLRGLGWPSTAADAMLATFHGVSMIATIPIAMLSDRLGTRRRVLIVAAVMTATGVGLLSIADGLLIIAAVVLAGLTRDGFMAVLMTLIIEIRGIGATFAGTAAGVVMACSMVARALSPPLGNSLAVINPSLPFVFWSAMALIGLLGLFMVKENA